MNRILRFTMLVLLAAVLSALAAGCASTNKEIADHAFVQGDWDRAVAYYDLAIDDSLDPAQIEWLRRRREAAAQRTAHARLAEARRLRGEGRYEAAVAEAEQARESHGSEVVAESARRMEREYAATLRQDAIGLVAKQDWPAATEKLRRAQKLAPTEEGAEMLAHAEKRLGDWHEVRYEQAVTEARAAMKVHDWKRATELFAAAAEHGDDVRMENEAAFVKRMRDAEDAALRGEYRRAQALFDAALAHGIMTDHVQARRLAAVPGRYRVTLHGAILLPFRPGAESPWDRAPGIPDRLPGAGDLIANLRYYLRGDLDLRAAELARDMQEYRLGAAAPDPWPQVTGPGILKGDSSLVQMDRLAPVWNLTFEVQGRTEDRAFLNVLIRDQDETEAEDLGVWQTTIGDLVGIRGTRTFFLFDEEGRLKGSGLLALRISVEPVR